MKMKVVTKDFTNYAQLTPEQIKKIRNRKYQRKFQLPRMKARLEKKIASGKKIGRGYTLKQIDKQLKKSNEVIFKLRGKGPGRPKKATVTNVTA